MSMYISFAFVPACEPGMLFCVFRRIIVYPPFLIYLETALKREAGCFKEYWEVIHVRRYKVIDYLINEQIRDKEVRVIGVEGNQLGVMSLADARGIADEAGLDLIRVSPNAKPPVCRIADYGKFRYEQMRKEKEAKKKQKIIDIKEIRLSPNIDDNDLNTKINMARKFLAKGDRVKVTLRFRGRELAYVNKRKEVLDDFAEKLSDISVIDKPAKFEGRSMIMFLAAKK